MTQLDDAFDVLTQLRELLPAPGTVCIGTSSELPHSYTVEWAWRMPSGRFMHYKQMFDDELLSRTPSDVLRHQLGLCQDVMRRGFANPSSVKGEIQ